MICFSSRQLFLGIDLDGIHYQDIISEMGQRYNIHPLVQIDMKTFEQRTKLDVLDDALFLVCKLIYRDVNGTGRIHTEQISFYVKENLLITLQETPKNLFDSLKSKNFDFFQMNFLMISVF